MDEPYLHNLIKQFSYYRTLGERTFSQLGDDELLHRPTPSTNSIAIIVCHLSGNMKSRFTDFFTSDGEKEWRNRDREFEEVLYTREELLVAWNEGWDCLFNTLESIRPEDLKRLVYIRNIGHQVIEALDRQLAHYAYHVGQIVYIGTMAKGEAWQSLSIPKGQSKAYNRQRFDQSKRRGHFTDDLLDTN